jgi:hypothetical protein
MSMPPPFSADPSDDGIPAADPGAGAPSPAAGFGVGGEEPDRVPEGDPGDEQDADVETPFRTPDPRKVGPGAPG